MKILVLGGYGVFGGRLAELLADLDGLELVISGRSIAKANAFCAGIVGAATMTPLMLDRRDIKGGIKTQAPDIVVDASGPFQQYGDDPYGVIKACIDARVNYLDFADAADFVFGVAQFDEAAKAADVFVLSGVSSFPVLTAAVLKELSKTMAIESVAGGIAPSPFAGVGLNVMRAVVGYAGAPVKLMRNGVPATGYGLCESMRYTIAPPGLLPLRNLYFSLVDVPDLQVIPPRYDTLQDIWMGAGPVPEVLHRVLNWLAKARVMLRLPSLEPFAPFSYWILNLMKFGEHRGGMFVHVKGSHDGISVHASWHLLAEGDSGPYIPSMAIEGVVRRCQAGLPPQPGARAALDALTLKDYDALFEGKDIHTGVRTSNNLKGALYERALGSAYTALPQQIQDIHRIGKGHVWAGKAQVTRGKGALARLIAMAFGFPQEVSETPVSVKMVPDKGGERWTRTFGDHVFSSFQYAGTGRNAALVVERFGLIHVGLATVMNDDKLYLVPRRWTIFGIPLPGFLLPGGDSFEHEQDGMFRFNVTIKAPIIGLIVAYKGWLKPVIN